MIISIKISFFPERFMVGNHRYVHSFHSFFFFFGSITIPFELQQFNDPDTGANSCKLLRLKIHCGHNLAKKDIFGASDPYVRIDLLSKSDRSVIDSLYTKTKKKTLNPCWNEEFIIRVLPASHQILMEVFDENRLTRDDFLGKVDLALNNIPTETTDMVIEPQRYTLQQRSQKSKVRGHLEIYHAYIDAPATSTTHSTSTLDAGEESIDDNDDVCIQ